MGIEIQFVDYQLNRYLNIVGISVDLGSILPWDQFFSAFSPSEI